MLAILCGAGAGQTKRPITKDHLFSSIRLGKQEKMTATRYVELIKQEKVDFRLTENEIRQLRIVGGYLGKRGLYDLIKAIRENYREDAPPTKARIRKDLPRVGKDGEPLTLITEIEIKGGTLELSYLGALMRAAGYKGPSAVMSILTVKNSEESDDNLEIGARPEAAGATEKAISKTLEPGEQFDFPAGVNAASVYLFTMTTVKIDIAFRPMPIESLTVRDWLETDEGKRFVSQMLTDIDKLVDEARAIDLRDYKAAIRTYNEWVDKVSLGLGQVDLRMRRLDKRTSYKLDWDTGNHSFVETFSDEQRSKQGLRLDINSAILGLELARSQVKVDTSAYWFK
ncbi:MAG: hypothetical protein QOD75_4022 [Blastocatellia bacterium]|jgi:hypothetical protein|nr:hypothetical protein [Blastocatellia bacterium]